MAAVRSNPCGASELAQFRSLFTGRADVFGTYDLQTGAVRQVKAPVTDAVLAAHLAGKQPYGVYLLNGDRTAAAVVDFDTPDLNPVVDCVDHARSYGLPGYIERSKSKGHHVWFFLPTDGVPAWKPRRVLNHILEEIDQQNVELFPKQDRLDAHCRYGNFINAPLFRPLVERGRTVFVPRRDPHRPFADQWSFLAQVERIGEGRLDEIISANDLTATAVPEAPNSNLPIEIAPGFALPPCAQRMLSGGVRQFQRVSCFRLAVHLRRAGVPQDLAEGLLLHWSAKNRPHHGKRVITADEIRAQVSDAYRKHYRSYGCESEAVRPFCDTNCPVYLTQSLRSNAAAPSSAVTRTQQSRSLAMSTTPNRPVQEFRVRNLSLAIWQNEADRDGRKVVVHSITINKRYRDPSSGGWRDSSSFFADDLPRLRLLLDKAYEYLLLGDARTEVSNESAPASSQ